MTEQTKTIQEQISAFPQEIQDYIRELQEKCFHVDDMIEFISEWGEYDFFKYYEEYVETAEAFGYDEVDYFINENSIDDIGKIEDAYMGKYGTFRDFAEEMFLQSHVVSEEVRSYLDWDYICDEYEHDYDYDRKTGAVFNRHF